MSEQADRLIKLAEEMRKAQLDAMWKDVAKDISAILNRIIKGENK